MPPNLLRIGVRGSRAAMAKRRVSRTPILGSRSPRWREARTAMKVDADEPRR